MHTPSNNNKNRNTMSKTPKSINIRRIAMLNKYINGIELAAVYIH